MILAFGPVVALVLLGAWIALRSGVSEAATSRRLKQLVANFSELALRILAYGVGLLAIERIMGLPVLTPW